jgi:hypothetical protein
LLICELLIADLPIAGLVQSTINNQQPQSTIPNHQFNKSTIRNLQSINLQTRNPTIYNPQSTMETICGLKAALQTAVIYQPISCSTLNVRSNGGTT